MVVIIILAGFIAFAFTMVLLPVVDEYRKTAGCEADEEIVKIEPA